MEVPAGAFEHADDYISIDWEIWFPDHCYVCHVATRFLDDAEFTGKCGVHCVRLS
jgi:hypothetical protein